MFDIGWSEMLIVGVVALIVVGPKDLPKMFHTLGEITGKARGMAREFQRAMDAAAKETGVNDIVKDFKRGASGQSFKDAASKAAGFDEIDKEFDDLRKMGKGNLLKPDPEEKTGGAPKPVGADGSPLMPDPAAPSVDDHAEAEDDEIAAQDLARRNAELSSTEAERLKKAEKAAEARRQAAEIRARREAEAAEAAEASQDAAETPRTAPTSAPPAAQQPES